MPLSTIPECHAVIDRHELHQRCVRPMTNVVTHLHYRPYHVMAFRVAAAVSVKSHAVPQAFDVAVTRMQAIRR